LLLRAGLDTLAVEFDAERACRWTDSVVIQGVRTGVTNLGVAIRKGYPVDLGLLGGLTAAKDATELCWNSE